MSPAPWVACPFLCVDTETSGLSYADDRIVEVACVDVHEDGSVERSWSTIVACGVEIPEAAANVHGITTKRAAAEGIEPARALAAVADRIHEHHHTHGGQAAVVMYNARFDLPLLIAEADRHGVDFPAFAPILDPYLIDRMCDRYRRGKRQLTLVADHYGVPLAVEDAHGACADAVAAGRVMWKLLEKFPEIGTHSLASMWLRQVKGAEADRLRFAEYMRSKVDPEFQPDAPGWPIPAWPPAPKREQAS